MYRLTHRRGQTYTDDSESLQADVMRFMAIIAFCLIADKLNRAVAMQQTLANLLIDITGDVSRLQRNLDRENDLAA